MKLVVQKNHFGCQIWYRSPAPAKKRRHSGQKSAVIQFQFGYDITLALATDLHNLQIYFASANGRKISRFEFS